MEYLIGVGLAVGVCVFAMLAGFDRYRLLYPTVVAANATDYILFAVMGSHACVGLGIPGGCRLFRGSGGRLQEEPVVGTSGSLLRATEARR